MTEKRLTREAIAHIEIGTTAISKVMSWVVSLSFLTFVFAVPIVQYQMDNRGQKVAGFINETSNDTQTGVSIFSAIKRKNILTLEKLDLLETSLEEGSFLRSVFLPPIQSIFLNTLGQGNEKVVVGHDGWLFFRPGVDSLTGRPLLDTDHLQMRFEGHELWETPVQPDPLKAIVDFHNQLKRRGVELILVPIPVKPSIHGDKLSGNSFPIPPVNQDWEKFLGQLKELDITVFDSRSLLQQYAQEHGAAFLKTDTHWLPGAMDVVAKQLAEKIKADFPTSESPQEFNLQQQSIEAEGDVAKMLTLPENNIPVLQSVIVDQVVNNENELWQPDTESEILLLGDSFTNIYSTVGLGWGRTGGFAEHLSYHLQRPIDLLSRNDSGAFVTREMLALELARGRDRLHGKKVVIWEFAERELTHGDWKLIDLTLGSPTDSSFFVSEAEKPVIVQGVVGAVSKSPRPGSVPYRDNIITLHLVDIKGEKVDFAADQALVYGFGMRDNTLTDMANLRPGDRVDISLSAWDAVEGEYGSYRRSPLDDEMMELELPNWGTLHHEK